eukprot:scaffold681_cov173-Ochromonas_danica.AAC.31
MENTTIPSEPYETLPQALLQTVRTLGSGLPPLPSSSSKTSAATHMMTAMTSSHSNILLPSSPSLLVLPTEPSTTTSTTEEQSSSSSTHNQPMIFEVGSLVNVLPRTWAGINKLGGVGRVEEVQHVDTIGPVYSVKYVLDGLRDEDIPAAFVEAYSELNRSSRRSKRSLGQTTKDDDITSPTGGKEKSPFRPHGKENYENEDHHLTSNKAAVTRRGNITLVITAIEGKYNIDQKLAKFLSLFTQVSLSCDFSDTVSHLVVSVDRNNLMRQRTMKYMQALVKGAWIVSTKWIEDSIAAGSILAETDYEVRGNIKAFIEHAPRRARLEHSKRNRKGLFFGYHVLLFGVFPLPGPARSDVEYLLLRCGASVFTNIEQYARAIRDSEEDNGSSSSSQVFAKVIIGSSAEWCPAADVHQALLQTQLPVEENSTIVTAIWLMDCITNYSILPFDNYLIS